MRGLFTKSAALLLLIASWASARAQVGFGDVGVLANTTVPATLTTKSTLIGPYPVDAGPFTAMTYLRLEFAPMPGSNLTSCTVAVDSDLPVWTLGGAISAQDCMVQGIATAGPVNANNVRLDVSVHGIGAVKVRLLGSLGTLATGTIGPAGPSTLGGIFSKDCSTGGAGQFVQTISTNGSITCGTPAGGGDISSTPLASQHIWQPSSTDFEVNNFAVRRYLTANSPYNWTASPVSPATISIGSDTVTIPSCPPGISTNDQFVAVSGSGGTEYPKLTAASCPYGSSGTVTFTATLVQNAGYTVSTATGGVKECSEDAKVTPTNPTGTPARGVCIVAPGYEPNIYAEAYIEATGQTIDFSGGTMLQCWIAWPSTCLHLGNDSNANSFQHITVINPTLRAMVPAAGGLATNANNSRVINYLFRNSATGAYFEKMYVNYNDQAAVLDGFDPSSGNNTGQCNASDCSTAIYSPGPFSTNAGITWVKNANLSLNCQANGVDWNNANTLRISDSVLQAYPEFGVRATAQFATNPAVDLDNVYMEVGNCSNPLGVGQMGLNSNGITLIRGGEGPAGIIPTPSCGGSAGSTNFNYYVIPHHATFGVGWPLYAARTAANCSGMATVKFPQIPGASTYDLIRTSGALATAVPYGVLPGGSPTAFGSVATGITCSATPCTVSDDTSLNTSAYTVATGVYFPYVPYWPGSVFLTAQSDTNSLVTPPTLNLDNQAGLLIQTSIGPRAPSVFASKCSAFAFSGVLTYASCLQGNSSGNSNAANTGTVLAMGVQSGGTTGGFKGRINFTIGTSSSVQGMDVITLLDSNFIKTMADGNKRPAWDAADTAIGFDDPSSGGTAPASNRLSFRAPVSISNYINSLPDGSSWLERLTSSLKEFKTVVQMDSTLSVTGGITGSLTGNSSTATALATTPTQCSGQVATGIQANGNANCTSVATGNVSNSGTPTLGQPASWIDATHVVGSTLYLDASQFTGSDPSVKINNCLAALVTATGGTCDARALAGNYTLTQEIDVGHTTTPIYGIKLILPQWGTWTWNGITNGTSCGIRVYSGGTVAGNDMGGTGNKMLIRASATSVMDAMLCTDPAPATGGAYVHISGFKIDNGNAATFTNGLAHIQFLYDQSEVKNVYAFNATGDAWHIESVCCGTVFWNIQGITAAATGGVPLTFGKSGATLTSTDVGIYNSTFNLPGNSHPDILITGGTTTQSPTFFNVYMEGNGATDTTTPMVEMNTAEGARFIGGQAKTEGGTAKPIFHVTAPYSGLDVQGFSVWNSTTCVVDAVTGVTVPVVNYTGSQGECGAYSSLAAYRGPSSFTQLTVTGPTLLGSGNPQVLDGVAGNSDIKGQLTLSSGTASYFFSNSYATAPVCTVSDTTAGNIAVPTTSTSQLTITGTGSDVVNYICLGGT